MNQPEIPQLTPEQTAGVGAILSRTIFLLARSQGWGKTCLNCSHFREGEDVCTLAVPPIKPPARVILTGCGAHDETPF